MTAHARRVTLCSVKHVGIVAHSSEGAALCFRAFCQEGIAELGPDEHPDVTLDCIALARSMPAGEVGDYASIRATLAVNVRRLAAVGADFFICPDNTAHIALEQPGVEFALAGAATGGGGGGPFVRRPRSSPSDATVLTSQPVAEPGGCRC